VNDAASTADANAGTYADGITIGGAQGANGFTASNYTITYEPGDLTIEPRPLVVAARAESKVVGTPDPALTFAADPVLVAGDEWEGRLQRAAGETVGEYAILRGTLGIADGNRGRNYAMRFEGNEFAILPDPTVGPEDSGADLPIAESGGGGDFPGEGSRLGPLDWFEASLGRLAEEDLARETGSGEDRAVLTVASAGIGLTVMHKLEQPDGEYHFEVVRDFPGRLAKFDEQTIRLELPGDLFANGSVSRGLRLETEVVLPGGEVLEEVPDWIRVTLPTEGRPGFLEAEIPEDIGREGVQVRILAEAREGSRDRTALYLEVRRTAGNPSDRGDRQGAASTDDLFSLLRPSGPWPGLPGDSGGVAGPP